MVVLSYFSPLIHFTLLKRRQSLLFDLNYTPSNNQHRKIAIQKMSNVAVKKEPSPPPRDGVWSPRYSRSPSTDSVVVEQEINLGDQGSWSQPIHGLPLPPQQKLVIITASRSSRLLQNLIHPRTRDSRGSTSPMGYLVRSAIRRLLGLANRGPIL